MNNSVLRTLILALGISALVLGIIGIFIPLLPTTPFLLLAAWCFLKSSPRLHRWLYQHPFLGKPLRDWDKNQSIARSTKILATLMIISSLVFMWMRPIKFEVLVLITMLLLSVLGFILTRNSVSK